MHRWEMILSELERLSAHHDRARQVVLRHVRSVPVREMSLAALAQETRLRSEEYAPEISASLAAWRWGGNFSNLSELAAVWLHARLNVALLWLGMMVETAGWQQVFPEPEMTDEEVIRWLLREWWFLHGVNLRAVLERGLE